MDDITEITLWLPEQWSDDVIDGALNHINNPDGDTILTAIDSIDNDYSVLKINLMNQVIDSLRIANIDTTSVIDVVHKYLI